MIEPNFNLLLWIIFIAYGISGIGSIVGGAIGGPKPRNYGIPDVLVGLVMLLICFIVCIF